MERHNLWHITLLRCTPVIHIGRCLTLPGQRTWRLPIGSKWSGRTFDVFQRGRIWRPKQNAWLNGKKSPAWVVQSFQKLNLMNWVVFIGQKHVLSPLLLIHRAWSCFWHVLHKEFMRVWHTRKSRGRDVRTVKFLNFYRRNRTSGGGFLFLRQAW